MKNKIKINKLKFNFNNSAIELLKNLELDNIKSNDVIYYNSINADEIISKIK